MKLAFAGTPEFAAVILDALIGSGHSIEAVFTRPDARAGRGNRVAESPVKQRAAAAGIDVHQPRTMRTPDAAQTLAALAPDALVVAAFGFLLPAPILAMPRLGCINVHASVLPRWRGAAPVHHAILAGDPRTGVSIMRMDAGLDTGPILATRTCAIGPEDTTGSLTGRLAELGATALVDTLRALEDGAVEALPQDESRATIAPKLSKPQAAIDWARPATEIERMVRAFDPWPVAHTCPAEGDAPAFRVWRAKVVPGDPARAPGTVLRCDETGLVVATARGALAITELQPPGARRMSTAEFVRGRRLAPGTRLGAEPPAGRRSARGRPGAARTDARPPARTASSFRSGGPRSPA